MRIVHDPKRIFAALLILLLCAAAPAAPPAQSESAKLNAEARTLLRSDPQRALQKAQQALASAQRDHDAAGEAGARINLGSIERQRGRYDQAVIEFERAVAISRDLPDRVAYAGALANLGITLDLGGLHAEALETQGEALAIYEKQHDFARASAVLINLGNTLDSLGDQTRSRDHYQRALDMKRAYGITKGVGAVLNNLADLALEDGTTEQAVELLNQAIAAHKQEGDRIGEGLALSNRGIAQARAGRFDAALSDIQQGEAIARDLEHAVGLSAALRARAEVWLLRARSLDGEPRTYALLNAEREARAALVGSSDSDDPQRRQRAKRLLADVLALRGDAERAIALIDEIEAEDAALRAQHDEARVAVVRARYENQQADTEMALLRERETAQTAELARNRILLRSAMGAGIAALVAIVLLFWIARERRNRAEALRAHGDALKEALDHAEAQGRRARKAADLNQRLLALAGEDLQTPLIEIRGSAERLLSAHHAHPDLSRAMAAVARHATDLMQIVQRMRDSAHVGEDPAAAGVSCDLGAVIVRCVAEVEARARQRQQRIREFIEPEVMVPLAVETATQALIELLDQALRLNPSDCNIDITLRSEAERAVLTLSDHDGALRELAAKRLTPQPGARDSSRRFGLSLLRETIARTGGEVDSIPAAAPETGQLLRLVLPLAETVGG